MFTGVCRKVLSRKEMFGVPVRYVGHQQGKPAASAETFIGPVALPQRLDKPSADASMGDLNGEGNGRFIGVARRQ
jgi:hypothetical protein